MVYCFGGYELDEERRELRSSSGVSHLEPQVFDLLAYLLRHHDRVVTKVELLDEVWGTRDVGESALSSRIKTARQAVGDSGAQQTVIRTVYGRGFRFVAPVQVRSSGRAGPGRLSRDPAALVGRASHLHRLDAAVDVAAGGRRRAVFRDR